MKLFKLGRMSLMVAMVAFCALAISQSAHAEKSFYDKYGQDIQKTTIVSLGHAGAACVAGVDSCLQWAAKGGAAALGAIIIEKNIPWEDVPWIKEWSKQTRQNVMTALLSGTMAAAGEVKGKDWTNFQEFFAGFAVGAATSYAADPIVDWANSD